MCFLKIFLFMKVLASGVSRLYDWLASALKATAVISSFHLVVIVMVD